MQLILSHRRKHRVSFKMFYFTICSSPLHREDMLRQREVDKVVVAISNANIVKF